MILTNIFVYFFTETVPLRTVNRQCSSGLQAVADVAAAIKAGFYDIGKDQFSIWCWIAINKTQPSPEWN